MPPPDPKVEHGRARRQVDERGRIAAAERRGHGVVGSSCVSASEYRFEVIGSPQPQAVVRSSLVASIRVVTALAMAPYFSRTAC